MIDENLLHSIVTTQNENKPELVFNEGGDKVILAHEDDEQSSASSEGENDPVLIKIKVMPAVLKKDQRAATVLSPEGTGCSRRQQKTLSSHGALLASSSRRHDGILLILTRTIYPAGRHP